MSEKKQSVYANIADDILSKIKSDVYLIGSLLPAEREFMEIYSVQRTTVRRGLDILSREGYIKKVAGLGSVVESKFPLDITANKTVVSTDTAKNSIPVSTVLLPHDNTDKFPSVLVDLLASFGKNGTGFMTSRQSEIGKDSTVISIGVVPSMQKNVCFALFQSDDYRSVVLDGDKAAFTALTYLEELGHKNIGFIGTNSSLGFENALYDSFSAVNSFFDEDFVYLSSADEKCGFDGFSELFRRHGSKLSAVCTANDEIAKGVIKAAKYYKLNIPSDLSVISLCSSNKNAASDAIYYDTDELSKEILYGASNTSRIATVLFSGSLNLKGTCDKAAALDDKKNMSDFLL